MKIFFLLSFIFTILFSNQTQIILGAFSTQRSAMLVKADIDKIIKNDLKLHNFMNKNSLKTKYKKHGKYTIVTIEPFNDIITMHSVLNRFKDTKYKGAYKLNLNPTKSKSSDKTTEKPEIIDDPLLMPEPDIKNIKVIPLAQKNTVKHIEKEEKAKIILDQTISEQTNIPIIFKTSSIELILIITILTLIIIYFIYKKSQYQIKDDITELSSILNKEKKHLTIPLEDTVKDKFDTDKQPQEADQPIVMQEIPEAIHFDILKEEEKSILSKELKKTVKSHGKITKEHFKEFAGKRILVAEDNIINQKVIINLFKDSGVEITTVDDGQFLLETLEKDCTYDFILMDAHMPRVDGFEATRKIKINQNYNHIIIIALSGDTAADDIRKMTESGMDEHLEKPLRMDALYDLLYAYNNSEKTLLNHTIELDIDQGINICADDINFYHEILNEFVNTYSDSHIKIQEFLDMKKIQEADRYLLDISGIAANIGANNISSILLSLKESFNNQENKKCTELIKNYAKSLHNLLEEINQYNNLKS